MPHPITQPNPITFPIPEPTEPPRNLALIGYPQWTLRLGPSGDLGYYDGPGIHDRRDPLRYIAGIETRPESPDNQDDRRACLDALIPHGLNPADYPTGNWPEGDPLTMVRAMVRALNAKHARPAPTLDTAWVARAWPELAPNIAAIANGADTVYSFTWARPNPPIEINLNSQWRHAATALRALSPDVRAACAPILAQAEIARVSRTVSWILASRRATRSQPAPHVEPVDPLQPLRDRLTLRRQTLRKQLKAEIVQRLRYAHTAELDLAASHIVVRTPFRFLSRVKPAHVLRRYRLNITRHPTPAPTKREIYQMHTPAAILAACVRRLRSDGILAPSITIPPPEHLTPDLRATRLALARLRVMPAQFNPTLRDAWRMVRPYILPCLSAAEQRRATATLPSLRRPLGAPPRDINNPDIIPQIRRSYHSQTRTTRAPSPAIAGCEYEICLQCDPDHVPAPRSWHVETDGSLQPKGSEIGAEIISPPMPWARMSANLLALVQHLQPYSPRGGVERVCGLHITSAIPASRVESARRFLSILHSRGQYQKLTGRHSSDSLRYADPAASGKYAALNIRRESGNLALVELRSFTSTGDLDSMRARLDCARLLFDLFNDEQASIHRPEDIDQTTGLPRGWEHPHAATFAARIGA